MRCPGPLAALICVPLLGLPLSGCGVVDVLDEIVEEGAVFSVEEDHCMGLGGEEYALHFAGVISDDRCPPGTTCERPGEAVLRLRFLAPEVSPVVRVVDLAGRVDAGDEEGHETVAAFGFRVTLLQLDPNPTGRDAGGPPVATFRLDRVR